MGIVGGGRVKINDAATLALLRGCRMGGTLGWVGGMCCVGSVARSSGRTASLV